MEPAIDGLERYLLKDFGFVAFAPATVVLDVGCGQGAQLQELRQKGCRAVGIDLRLKPLLNCRSMGLWVVQACAEKISLKSESVDGLVCKVVIPYTNEATALGEIARVLKAGAMGYICYHGAGFYLRYALLGPSWKSRFYGLRTMLNTWLYAVTGRRLPGFLGDTLYQSRGRLAAYYRRNGLHLLQDSPARTYLGFPVFLYHIINKVTH